MKKLLVIILIILGTSAIFGFNYDYGATIDSYTGYNFTDSSYLFGFEKLSIYGSAQVNNNISLAIDGFYKFQFSTSSNNEIKHILDFSLLSGSFIINNMKLDVGRNLMSDYSSRILNHKLDGAVFSLPLGPGDLIAKVGYSGLVNQNEVSILQTSSDEENIPRIIEGADYIIDQNTGTLWFSIYSLQDILNIDSNLSVYIGGGYTGIIGTDVFYTLQGNFQTGLFPYFNDKSEVNGAVIAAGIGDINVVWFIRGESSIVKRMTPFVSFDFGISSGDSNLISADLAVADQPDEINNGVTIYTPISTGGPGSIYSINYQNLTYFKVKGSITPLDKLQTEIGTVLYFRTVEGPTSDNTLNNEEKGNYLGVEFNMGVNYRPLSDLGISLNGGLFIPDGTINESNVSGMLGLYASLTL